MGVFLGVIERTEYSYDWGGVFFNYKPIAEVRNSTIMELTDQEQRDLLPESERLNICFSFSKYSSSERERMEKTFPDGSLILFEFTLSDLQDNFKGDGSRNQTGYKVSAIDMLEKGMILPIGNQGVYFAIKKDQIVSDFNNDVVVEIDAPGLVEGQNVLVERDDFWAGPYRVGYREFTSSYYVKPQIKENKYTVSGYRCEDVRSTLLTYNKSLPFDEDSKDLKWLVTCPQIGAVWEQFDIISDDTLVEIFKDSINSDMISGGSLKLDDIPALVEQFNDSALVGSNLSEEIRNSRSDRLVRIMASEKDLDETLRRITEVICDLLVKYQDSQNVDDWVKALLNRTPQLLNQLQNTRTISQHIEELNGKLEDLQEQKAQLDQECEETRQRTESIKEQAVAEQKQELLGEIQQKEAAIVALDARINERQNVLGIMEDIDALRAECDKIKKELDFERQHRAQVQSENRDLELQFTETLTKYHEKMVEISLDGFMSSKMLHAAAEWEAEQDKAQQSNIADIVNSVPAQNKEPGDLAEYLYQAVHIYRPNYSKNTIINIAICITQGFLTVFSGEPGCGKTSICDIFAEVLGLNKISDLVACPADEKENANRYIPVSVERGWTSKRDLIGYYNPLSKSFDKSNRRVYNALYQLDIEKKKGICKLPYLILLDEANLSPMEYYWSDFMNICDNMNSQSRVNLGENYVFSIPETLHFVATINNDHTTETLSPRLIDRAWVITLPQFTQHEFSDSNFENDSSSNDIAIITWESLREAFIPNEEQCNFSPEIQKCYDAILGLLRKKKIVVSPRADHAIKRYWTVASRMFEPDETETIASVVAFDYAVAQRILPKIAGSGESYEQWLEEFRNLCNNNALNLSAKLLRDIIDRGNQQMKYYQFFC